MIFNTNRDAIAKGIAYVSEDRMHTGLIMAESIHHNIISTIFHKITDKLQIIQSSKAYASSQALIDSLKIKVSDSDLPVNTLSGGTHSEFRLQNGWQSTPKLLF